MRSRDIVGKTVAKIHQDRAYRSDDGSSICHAVHAIEFTDGTILHLVALEDGADFYPIDGHIQKRKDKQ